MPEPIARRRTTLVVVLAAVLAIAVLGLAGLNAPEVAVFALFGWLGSLTAVPLLSCVLMAVFFAPAFLLARRRWKVGVGATTVLVVAALVPTSLVALWIHGESFARSVFYEVPVEITFEPSDEAFAAIPDDFRSAAPFAAWTWSVDGAGCDGDGRILYPLFATTDSGIGPWREWNRWHFEGGAADGRFARAREAQRHTVEVTVRIARKYLGAARYRFSSQVAQIQVREERIPPRPGPAAPTRELPAPDAGSPLFTIPLVRGHAEFVFSDHRGHAWGVSTTTSTPRFAPVTRHVF